ncbi:MULTISPECIES: hypothetical protein [Trichocoleus]|nr:hypothetical protein [Trichocoleus sp. FACHB-46]
MSRQPRMNDIQRVGDLEIVQDLEFQRRAWAIQRLSWIGWGLIAVGALAGLFGSGPLSRGNVSSPSDSLQLEYDRFGRFHAPAKLKIILGAGSEQNGKVKVWLSRSYLESTEVQQVTPQPEWVEASPDRLTYVFRTTALDRPTAVTFYLQPDQVGLQTGQVGVVTGPTLRFNQLIYP